MIPPDSPLAPKYWMDETSGVLKPVVEKLLTASDLTPREIGLVRDYFKQWIDSPAWDRNPHLNPRSYAALIDLRASVREIQNMRDIARWVAASVSEGIDPL